MKRRIVVVLAMGMVSAACFAAADGKWLKKVPATDHARLNPVAGNAEAIASGANLFANNCSKCHGVDGAGKGSRPSMKSTRMAGTTDGDVAWLLKNGNPYRGMPGWGALPEQERWQLVAYVRSLNVVAPAALPTGVQP